MLKTEYFSSTPFGIKPNAQGIYGMEASIKNAKQKKDAFLKEIEEVISEIVSETIQFEFCNSGDYAGSLFAVITLSYYLKDKQ